jgi:hypothetical protein
MPFEVNERASGSHRHGANKEAPTSASADRTVRSTIRSAT